MLNLSIQLNVVQIGCFVEISACLLFLIYCSSYCFLIYFDHYDSFLKVIQIFKTLIEVSFNCNLKLVFFDFPSKRL